MANPRSARLRALMAVGAGLLALFLVAATLLYIVFSPSRDEVLRLPSPNGGIVATVVEINGGATTSFGYEIRLTRAGFNLGGTEVASLYEASRSDQAYGVNLRWVSEDELHIEYLTAHSAELVPFRIFAPSVRVVLKPGVSDSSAPAGGMLYNLQGRPSVGG